MMNWADRPSEHHGWLVVAKQWFDMRELQGGDQDETTSMVPME